MTKHCSHLRLTPGSGLPLREQWNEILANSYYPAEASRMVGDDFYGDVTQCSIGEMQVSRMRCGRHRLNRTSRHIAINHDNSIIFAIPVAGSFSFRQFGRMGTVTLDHALMFDTSVPYNYDVTDGYENICFRVDRKAFQARLPDIQDACARPLRLDRSSSWFLRTTLAQMLEAGAQADARSHRVLEHNIAAYVLDLAIEVIFHSYLSGMEVDGARHQDAQLRRIAGYIMRNLQDPDLSPQSVAAANGISSSYLYKLFKPTGETVAQWIMRRRLEVCQARLSDPQYRHQSITQIAFDLGFNNLSHFSTRFRQAYACSPRDFRRLEAPGRG